ncbi:unnamed protein product [Brassica rapa subsp. narinosa]
MLQRELIRAMQALGRMKAEHQKFVMPEMTVLMSSNLAAKERDLTDQLLNRAFTCWIKGSQFARVIFLESRGTPKYRKGRWPRDIPVEA